jgi:hypothetical protein
LVRIPLTARADRYDRRYFDRWYRDAKQRVFTPLERARRVALAVSTAEYVLGRRLRNALDVGAGEGHWRGPLLALRPRCRYTGIDPSPYAVERFGAARNITLGSVESLGRLRLGGPFDLVLAFGFLNLLEPGALALALKALRPFVRGVALLELFTSADPLTGDIRRYHLAPPTAYRRLLKRVGFHALGMHLYATQPVSDELATLERS